MSKIQEVLYTGKTHTTGGRDGASRSSDGKLDVKLSAPWSKGDGTNPEQLLAAGWSACYLGALGKAAAEFKVAMPADAAIDAEVDLAKGEDGFQLQARLHVSLPGVEKEIAQRMIERAHATCPYSKALGASTGVQTTLA
ncbi:organic hydroperoxide resistance protein [Pseudoduganella sp. UC29_71]|uniref:organic hydroperoxide resistance protein n=1 Tax=Pseudoduganella sp. UC29_71 TaxID=3350174 RepID=UPI00366D35B7